METGKSAVHASIRDKEATMQGRSEAPKPHRRLLISAAAKGTRELEMGPIPSCG